MSEMTNLEVRLVPFEELELPELYEILRLRSEIFVVEQNCVFPDMDNKDQGSWHLMIRDQARLAAYSRLLPPGLSYPEMSIGRVVTASFARRTGLGRILMEKSIDACYRVFGNGTIRIGAQYQLVSFYTSLGFVETGDIYDEDGIDHIEMLLHGLGSGVQ